MNSELTEKTDVKESRSSERPGGLGAAAPRTDSFGGWILYDGDCSSCTASARRFDRIFRRRGFLFLPLQTDWVMKRLDLEPGAPLEEMRVLTSDGRDIGGADAVIFLGRQIWWTWPFVALARLPGTHKLFDRGYRWIAAHRGCDHITCEIKERRLPSRRLTKTAVERPPLLEFWRGWIALIVFPPLALLARNRVAPWQFMWLMTSAIFLGCKWLTFEDRSCMSPLVALSFISFSGRGWTRKNFYAGPRVRCTRLENKRWSQVQPRNCPATCRTERAKFPRSPFLLR